MIKNKNKIKNIIMFFYFYYFLSLFYYICIKLHLYKITFI
jgi:hypothetical protein